MLFNFGQGSNAKSTLSDAVLKALGEYSVFLHDKAILGNEHDHGTEKMVFRGARWAVLEELPEAQVLRPAVIKKLIGTSKITARQMRQDNVTFEASHCLMVNSNHRPQVLENDRGTWRRLLAVPWPYTYKFEGERLDDEYDRRADPAVKQGLSRSIDVQKAALAWIVAGAVRFFAAGTCGEVPDAVQAETSLWRMDSDTFGTFFEQEMRLDKNHAVSSKELLEIYNDWLSDMGKRPVSDGYIATRLSSMKGAKSVHQKPVRRNSKTLTISTRDVLSSLPGQFRAWVGIRWLTDPEKLEHTA
jgi:P4 family phage/plasmid primase-like protien